MAETRCGEEFCICHTVVEYRSRMNCFRFNVTFSHTGDRVSTVGINLRTIPISFLEAKGLAQYAMLTVALSVALVSL